MEVDGDNHDGDEDEYEELKINEELAELPDNLADLRRKKFGTEKALLDELDKRGFGDLRVVLWKDEPYMICPSEEHNEFTNEYVQHFLLRCYKWAHCTETYKLNLVNGRSRYPDISYWGYPRCTSTHPVNGAFCWRNTFEYEAQAMNDIMNLGLEYKDGPVSTDRPRVGYLIVMKFTKNQRKMVNGEYATDVAGMDIYRLPHGTTIAKALDPSDPSAQHWCYKPGHPEVFITIRGEDLGIPPSTFVDRAHFMMSTLVGLSGGRHFSGDDEYKMKASKIYEGMRAVHEAMTS